MFYVGQKVVCVDASPARNPRSKFTFLVLNAVYTVTGFSHCSELGLVLAEDPDQLVHTRTGDPIGWVARRFRPLVERKTDISVFRKMLVPKHQTEDA